jgi:DNA-binding MarR family transcriptional regulator
MNCKSPKKYRKLTFADAQAIRTAREQNPALSLADLADKFGVTPMSISRVLRGEVHRKEKARKLTPPEVQELRYLAREGVQTQEDLAQRFGISQGEVSRIVNGELYARVPAATKEQEQSARKKAINERVEREYAEAMARIPRVDDRPTRTTEAPPVYQPPGSSDSGGQQP